MPAPKYYAESENIPKEEDMLVRMEHELHALSTIA